jgi:hypothetical protein
MKERPIIFSTPMVQAILDGRKTMTRRVLKIQPPDNKDWKLIRLTDSSSKDDAKNIGKLQWGLFDNPHHVSERDMRYFKCPYDEPGDVLWVRESFKPITPSGFTRGVSIIYKADMHGNKVSDHKWKPSIHMPRWSARIFLEITDVRVERLNDITRGDCMSEGCPFVNMANGANPKYWFTYLWESIHGPGSFDSKWVWVISFKQIQKPLA